MKSGEHINSIDLNENLREQVIWKQGVLQYLIVDNQIFFKVKIYD